MNSLRSIGLILPTAVALFAAPLPAQTIPPDRKALEEGLGAGMASYADPNDYPGPKHILDLADSLRLTEEQIKQIVAIADAMEARSRALGIRVIALEEKLEELFRSGEASEDQTRAIAVSIGTLRGELRAVHLGAHIEAREVLSPRQRTLYTALRYSAGRSQ